MTLRPKQSLELLQTRARKRFSQNFLTDAHWVERLTQPLLRRQDEVAEIWEIGPGLGALTERLVEKAEVPVRVFEIDAHLAGFLREKYPQVRLIEGDFMKYPLADELSQLSKPVGLISNLPYHLSSPIFFHLLEHRQGFHQMVLTFQKEFADRLIAAPGSKIYGAISVLAQYSFQITSIGNLPVSAFYPAPAVISQALRFQPIQREGVSYSDLDKVVKTAFLHRRKKLGNNLRNAFPGVDIPQALKTVGVREDVRAEALSLEQFLSLTELICEKRA